MRFIGDISYATSFYYITVTPERAISLISLIECQNILAVNTFFYHVGILSVLSAHTYFLRESR